MSTPAPLRDWPKPLQTVSVCISVGRALYFGWMERFDQPYVHWNDLDPVAKHAWVERAESVLNDLAPEKCSYGCGRFVDPMHAPFCSNLCSISAERDV